MANRAKRRHVESLERKGRMRFLATKPLVLPKPMTVKDETGDKEHDVSLPEVLQLMMESYSPSQSLVLNVPQLRSLNKVLDILESPHEDGYYAIEDTEAEVAKLLLEKAAPSIMLGHARNIPALIDALEGSPSKRPEPVKEVEGNEPSD